MFHTELNTLRFINLHVLCELVLLRKYFPLFPTSNHCRNPNSVVRPIIELVSEFWLESRSDGMVDYICFRLIDIAAQKSTRVLVQQIWTCWDEFAYPTRVYDRLKSMIGYCFRLIDIAAQMMVLQGSHQAKADTRLDGSHTWCIIDLQRGRLVDAG